MALAPLTRLICIVDELRKLDPDMSLRSVSVLLHVAQDAGVSQVTLTRRAGMDVSRSAMSRIFQKLSNRSHPSEPNPLGLITMEDGADDLRFKQSKLTPKGQLVLAALQYAVGE